MTLLKSRMIVQYYGIVTRHIKDVFRIILKILKVTFWLSIISLAIYLIGCFCYNRVPFTKWCGVGQLTNHADDLGIFGYFITVDKCCQGHDSCPYFIKQNETRFNLKNSTPYTLSDCQCDETFRKCLKNTIKDAPYPDKFLALLIKIYFFNMLKMPCFQMNYNDPKYKNYDPFKTIGEKFAVLKPGKIFDILSWLIESS